MEEKKEKYISWKGVEPLPFAFWKPTGTYSEPLPHTLPPLRRYYLLFREPPVTVLKGGGHDELSRVGELF